jgi:hypothetical protein
MALEYPCIPSVTRGRRPLDITVYLPDDIGKRAKEAGLPFSQLLRGAVEEELDRQEAVMNTLEDIETYEVEIETPEGASVTGRITGKWIAGEDDVSAYLTEDERVLIYDERRYEVHDATEDPVAAFEGWFRDNEPDAYIQAMKAIGEKPVIDL